MQRVLVFGDAHVPTRKKIIPQEFYQHIEETDYDLALITGDLIREADLLKIIPPLPRSFIVKGNMDYTFGYNFHEEIQLDDFKVLLLHGTQLRPRGNIRQLHEILVNIDGDVAVHGHTHVAAIDQYKTKLFLNPGTITGAASGSTGTQEASFLELEVEGSHIHVVLHRKNSNLLTKTEVDYIKRNKQILRQAD
ncbi:MAG: Phosphoesterase [Candidatus Thorarchaeota archaeon]|nr:MAG: Phosphoesterase [Candidatus Thorarchaeota archaeon]